MAPPFLRSRNLTASIVLVVALVLRVALVPLHLGLGEHAHEDIPEHLHAALHDEDAHHHGEDDHTIEDHGDEGSMARTGKGAAGAGDLHLVDSGAAFPGPGLASLSLFEHAARPPDPWAGCTAEPRAPPVTA